MSNNELQAGDLVKIAPDAVYYVTSKPVSPTVTRTRWYISRISGNRALIGKSEDGNYSLDVPVDTKYLTKISD